MSGVTWTSKLGKVWDKAQIQAADEASHRRLRKLARLPHNKQCAECGSSPTCWCSVTLGVFVCMKCAQIHRNLGAHISKVKSCMGTYLWSPDELDAMEAKGNARAAAEFGGAAHMPRPKAPYDVVEQYARDKYVNGRWRNSSEAPAQDVAHLMQPAAQSPRSSQAHKAPAPAVHGASEFGEWGKEWDNSEWGNFDLMQGAVGSPRNVSRVAAAASGEDKNAPTSQAHITLDDMDSLLGL